jgi:hypothetical protein
MLANIIENSPFTALQHSKSNHRTLVHADCGGPTRAGSVAEPECPNLVWTDLACAPTGGQVLKEAAWHGQSGMSIPGARGGWNGKLHLAGAIQRLARESRRPATFCHLSAPPPEQLPCIFIIRCEPTAHGPLSQVFVSEPFGVCSPSLTEAAERGRAIIVSFKGAHF